MLEDGNMINTNKYKLDAIDFDQDDWELVNAIHSVQEKHRFKKLNILEIGSGKTCLIYSLCIEKMKWIEKVFSVDVINNVHYDGDDNYDENLKPDPLYYEKVTAFTSIYNHSKENVDSIEADANESKIIKSVKKVFKDDEVSVFITEYLKDDSYMDDIFENYGDILDENTMIIYKYLNQSKESVKYFNKLASKFSKIKRLENGIGTGIIYDVS